MVKRVPVLLHVCRLKSCRWPRIPFETEQHFKSCLALFFHGQYLVIARHNCGLPKDAKVRWLALSLHRSAISRFFRPYANIGCCILSLSIFHVAHTDGLLDEVVVLFGACMGINGSWDGMGRESYDTAVMNYVLHGIPAPLAPT